MGGKLQHTVLQIQGMTCSNCEMNIENALKQIEGVIKVKASYSNANVSIHSDSDCIKMSKIKEEIEKLDYKVENKSSKEDYKTSENKEEDGNVSSNYQLIGIAIILLAGYLVIKNTIGFNFVPEVNQNMGYGLLFIVGLLTSLHCIAMCGGINLSQCVSYKYDDISKYSKFKPSLMYNSGRVISYTVIGGIVGALGSIISFSGTAKGTVAILSGVFMIIMGLNMLNIFSWLRKLNPRMPKLFRNKLDDGKTQHGPLYIGLLNGLMPCGPLQAMQIYALGTGSFFAGAASMFFFSLGTTILMFSFGAASSYVSGKFTHKMMKASAMLVIILGVVMMSRGFNLSGVNVAFAETGSVAKIQDNVQLVTTEFDSRSYAPIVVQKGIPVKWTVVIDENDLNGCNNPVTIPKYNIIKELVPGENIIEFTPDEAGNIKYTCWMGMISSNIKVVDDISNVSDEDLQQEEELGLPSGCGSCAGGSAETRFTNDMPTDENY